MVRPQQRKVQHKRRISGGTRNESAVSASGVKRRRANVSRQEVRKIAVAKKSARNVLKQAKTIVQSRAEAADRIRARNRKLKRALNKTDQQKTLDGLLAAVEEIGAEPTPLALFASAVGVLQNGQGTDKASIPYLVGVVLATLPKLSPNVVISKLDDVQKVVLRVLHEYGPTDHTAAAKAVRLATDAAIRSASASALHAMRMAASAARSGSAKAQTLAEGGIDRANSHIKRLVRRSFAMLMSLKPSKQAQHGIDAFIGALRKFAAHLFTIDDHYKVLFGVFEDDDDDTKTKGGEGSDDDSEWEDMPSDAEDGEDAANGAKVPPALANSVLWNFRFAILELIPEVTAAMLEWTTHSNSASKAALTATANLVTVTCRRCVAEFAGFVQRPDGAVDEAQLAMLRDTFEPVLGHLIEALRGATNEGGRWAAITGCLAKVFTVSGLDVFKRAAYAQAPAKLAASIGMPQSLPPTGAPVCAGEELAARVANDDALSVHRLKPLPSLLEVLPSVRKLLLILDKVESSDSELPTSNTIAAICAIANCMTFREFYDVLPFDPFVPVQPAPGGRPTLARKEYSGQREHNDIWRRGYLVRLVWGKVSHHDSLETLNEFIFPRIAASKEAIQELQSQGCSHEAQQFVVLKDQYWQVVVGFCTHPVDVTVNSFKFMAQQIIQNLQVDEDGMLSTASYHGCRALDAICSGYHALAAEPDAFDMVEEDIEMLRKENDAQAKKEEEARLGDAFLERDDDVLHPHSYHYIPHAHALRVCNVIRKFSKNIFPKMCQVAENSTDAINSPVLAAIASFVPVCEPSVLQVALDTIMAVGKNVSEGVVAAGADGKMTAQRRVVLDIATAIVPSLDATFIPRLLEEIVVPSVRGTDAQPMSDAMRGALQKKGYRLLFHLFEHRLKSMTDSLPAVIELLVSTADATLPAALKSRLRCLLWALDACKIYSDNDLLSFGLRFVPEVSLCVRERSNQTRTLAIEWFDKFWRYCDVPDRFDAEGRPATVALIHHVMAGTAGRSPLAMSAAFIIVAKLLWCAVHSTAIDAPLINRLSKIIMSQVDSTKTEVRNASVVYCRVIAKLAAKSSKYDNGVRLDNQGTTLPKGEIAAGSPIAALLRAVAVTVSQAHVASSTRTQMHQLLDKLLDHFQPTELERHFPIGSRKFLQHVAKQRRRAEKLRKRGATKREEQAVVAELHRNDQAGRPLADVAGEDADVMMDLLDPSGIAGLAAAAPKLSATQRQRQMLESRDDADATAEEGYHIDYVEGKMRIRTTKQRDEEESEHRRKDTAERLMRQAAASRRGKKSTALQGPTLAGPELNDDGKRRRTAETEDWENEELFRVHGGPSNTPGNVAKQVEAATAGQNKEGRTAKLGSKRARMEQDIKTGDEYAPVGGAQGDIKRGNVDPFAYVPLNRALLNKRNQAQRVRRFAVVEGKTLKGRKAQRLADAARKDRQ